MVFPDDDPTIEENHVKVVNETVKTFNFKEKDFVYDPGEDRTNTIHLSIPVLIFK